MKKHMMLGVKTVAAIITAAVLGLVIGLFVSWKVGLLVGFGLAGLAFIVGSVLIARNMIRLAKNPGAMFTEAAPAFEGLGNMFEAFFGPAPGASASRNDAPPFSVPKVPPAPSVLPFPHSRYGSYGTPPKDVFGQAPPRV